MEGRERGAGGAVVETSGQGGAVSHTDTSGQRGREWVAWRAVQAQAQA
jgi:hypothetical protein